MPVVQPFPDVGLSFELGAWEPLPSPQGGPLLLGGANGATLQLTRLPVDPGDAGPRLAAAAIEQTAQRLERVTVPAAVVEVGAGLRAATVGGAVKELHVRVWAFDGGSAVVLVSFIAPGDDAAAGEAFVQTARPADVRVITPATALLQWVAAAQRTRWPEALYEAVAGELGLICALPRFAGLLHPVTDAELAAAGTTRDEFKQWALAAVPLAALDIGLEGSLVMNRRPSHNAALALLRPDGLAEVAKQLGQRFLVMVPSNAGFLAAEDAPPGRALLDLAAARLITAKAVEVSTQVLRVDGDQWSVA